MIKYHINNWITDQVQKMDRFKELTEENHCRLYGEIKNATLYGLENKIQDVFHSGIKNDNATNSLLIWVLGISDNFPGPYTKMKSEGSYPDIDSDFMQNSRSKVIEYISNKYGAENVAQIATFGKLKARAAIRAAARALECSVESGDLLAKQIPNIPNITIQDIIDTSSSFRSQINENEISKNIINTALDLEGLPNNLSVHASGIILSDNPIVDYVPLMIAKKEDSGILTQYEYKDVESNFLIKFDLLGLKTLDVIQGALELIKDRHGIVIDPYKINLEDPSIYKLINDGFLTLIFQMEGSAFSSAIQKIKPKDQNEISDLLAIVRPGPLEMGIIDQYVEAKFNNKKYDYGLKDQRLISEIWDICKTSYGLLIFQEQLIQMFVRLADFNEVEADDARRGTAKKKPEDLKILGEKFIPRAKAKGYAEEDLIKLFELFQSFSSYSFNRSHSVGYSVLTCITAWLSANYPLEFFSSALTIDAGKTDDVRRYIGALKQRGFGVEAPNINTSDVSFKIKDDSIIFGLTGIKGVGEGLSKKILKKRPKAGYKSLGDFIVRNIDLLNKKVVEQYAKSGAFSPFGINKASALQSVDNILDFMDVQKNVSDFYTIFDMCKIDLAGYFNMCKVAEVEKPDALEYEIETLGLYITKHPMKNCFVDPEKGLDIKAIIENPNLEGKVLTVGAICGIDIRKTKAKVNMATFNLTTESNSLKCIVFPKKYIEFQNEIQEGKVVAIIGRIQEDENEKQLSVDMIKDSANYLCKIKPKENQIINTWLSNIETDKYYNDKSIGIIINSSLSYILEK